MPRYAAFLRGVMPMNAKMPDLKRAFEKAGFTEVRTVLGSGNVVFSARAASDGALQRKAEAAMQKELGRAFPTIIRSVDELQALVAADPFSEYRLPADAKRIVTFLREAPAGAPSRLPEQDGARILQVSGREVFSSYVPTPKGPVFMSLIEKTFGQDVTTRTWDTVKKVAR
ncbi:MAG TPA: DUF1697 domain-containing protein [Myxococcaceae bacterium]|nr:DUF1697 domain-containing protein [Myxococcaceae bacterium]